MAFRVDYSAAPAKGQIERLSDGTIRAPARIARTGVQTYRFADGTVRREYRPDSEVFSPTSIATWRSMTLTVGHPSSDVSPQNWRSLAVGHVDGEVARENDPDDLSTGYVRGMCVVKDSATIDAITSGDIGELSAGYYVDFDPTPGVTPDGEPYDGVQRNIRGNHVALLPRGMGRAGPEVRLLTDAATGAGEGARLDVGYSTSEAKMTPDEIAKMKADLAAANAAITTLRADHDKVTAERDALRAAPPAATTTPVTSDARTDADVARLVTEGVSLRLAARRIADDIAIVDDKGALIADRPLMVATIKRTDAKFDDAGKSDVYIRMRFDWALEHATPIKPVHGSDSRVDRDDMPNLQAFIFGARTDERVPVADGPSAAHSRNEDAIAKARMKDAKRLKDAWKSKGDKPKPGDDDEDENRR